MQASHPNTAREFRLYRLVMATLWFTLVAHLLGLLTMATLLRPGMEDGIAALDRARYVAAHPWLWRLGWIPWNLAALGNLAFGMSLISYLSCRSNKAGSTFAYLSLFFTILAVIPDQGGEFLMDTRLVDEARAVVFYCSSPTDPRVALFSESQKELLLWLGAYANSLYIVMGLCWIVALCQAAPNSPWRPMLVGLTIASSLAFGFMSYLTEIRTFGDPNDFLAQFWIMVVTNGVAFGLLLGQMALMAIVLGDAHHQRYPSEDRRLHRISWPRGRALAFLSRFLNARGLRDLLRSNDLLMAPPVLASDIQQVVYLNWMVPTERVRDFLPAPLRFHEFNGKTIISLLTYQHGHFGPRLAGPLRSFFPSPFQSNWRFYVLPENPKAARDAIYFFKTTLSDLPFVVGSRLMSDGLPSHYAPDFIHQREGTIITTKMNNERGSAPDLKSRVQCTENKTLPQDFQPHFDSWDEAVLYLIEQNRGISIVKGLGHAIESRIDIPMDIETIEAAQCLEVQSDWLEDLIEGCEVFAFVVPSVSFKALGESVVEVDPNGSAQS